jgi:FlaA1/EpsC-like NDP-sugar epimerase
LAERISSSLALCPTFEPAAPVHQALSSDRAFFSFRIARNEALTQALPSSLRYTRLERHMSVLISILITFLVVVLILWLVQRLPVDARVRQIIQIVVIVVGIISLLRYLAVF